MGMEEEFEAVFDLLDPSLRGFLDADQIQEFYKAFFCTSVNPDHVQAAISQVCNGGERCPKFCFLDVLLEVERRRTVDERAWWDFQALDSRGQQRITLREALLLMKATHQDRFTPRTWHAFLESRPGNHDVSFDEIRTWLCNPPMLQDEGTWGLSEIVIAGERMNDEKRKADYEDHQEFLALQEDEFSQTLEVQDRHQYQAKFRSKAQRKLNRWVNLGVEALIFDDGRDYDMDYNMRNRVSVQDLLEALEQKYDILREKLLWEAIKKHVGDPIWSAMSEGEQQEQVLRLQMKEYQLRRTNDLDQISRLVVSYQYYDTRLEAVMGCLRSEFEHRAMEHQSRVAELQAQGRTDDQIYEMFADEHAHRVQGTTTCGQLLIDLHKRHVKERELLLSVLKMGNQRALTSAEMITEYTSLAAQQLIASYEGESFEYSAMATGLAERPQQYAGTGFDSDRDLSELLALERLHERKPRRPPKVTDDDGHLIGKNRGIVAWQVEVVRQLLKKHTHEREMMIYLLRGKESAKWLSIARRKSQEQREDRLKELRLQRSNCRQGPPEQLISKRAIHLKILLEGAALYHENRRSDLRGGHNLTDNQVSACLLADLQQRQAQEVERVVVEMQTMTAEALKELWRREHQSRIEEWLDNVSGIILSTFDLSEEDKALVQALEDKYNVLRDKILAEQLIVEYGKGTWQKMTEQERQQVMMKKRLEESRLRHDGKMEELAHLIRGKDNKQLLKLMGKNREAYEKKLAMRLARREQRQAMGLDSDESGESDSDGAGSSGHNILQDLQSRYNQDMHALIGVLRRQQGQEMSEQERQVLLLRLRRDKRRAETEESFDEAALLVGLAERNRLNMEERMKGDSERQLLLAKERLANHQRRKAEGEEQDESKDYKGLPQPDEGDPEAWRELALKEMDRKHLKERQLFLSILTDDGSAELRQAASKMVQRVRQERLRELNEEAETLNPDKKDEKESRRDILEEAGAIKSVLRKMTLETNSQDQKVEVDEVNASLLADLQEKQERESEVVMASLVSMSEGELSKLSMRQVWEAKMDVGKNLLAVFTQYEGAVEDAQILKALDKKYNALKSKLLIDVLRRQVGQEEWAKLSEQERQRRLVELGQEERKLRNEGKTDTLTALLGEHGRTETDLKRLMGCDPGEYKEKLKMRREKQTSEGGSPEVIEEELSEEEDENDPSKSFDPLEDIQRRYDHERETLLARLNSLETDEYMSEKERQAELIRLRLELRKARGEDSFVAAALVTGLAERNQVSVRLKNDGQRLVLLAKERIDALRRRRALGIIQEEEEDTLTSSNDRNSMQDAVIRTLEKKHRLEREDLYDFLYAKYDEDDVLIAENMTQEQRQDVLRDLLAKRLATSKTREHQTILEKASVIKMAGRKQQLERESTEKSINNDDVIVTIMADLQQQQARECETMLSQLPNKDLKSLVSMQQQNINEQKNKRNENVAFVLTTPDLSKQAGEQELVEALQGKFDALRDKILTEALVKQIGEAEWAMLSEKERQVKLIELRLEEQRLRQEGKHDEAAALMGDAITSQHALELLLGDTKKRQEEKMRERMEKRRQRMMQGMTDEEIQRLEQEEIEQEEEELKLKKPRNILEDLDNRLDEERDALLASLQDASDRLQNERECHLELACLRREQRKARKEQKFDAAALAVGLAKRAQDVEELCENERKRQEHLARWRLAERRQARTNSQQAKGVVGPVPLPQGELSEVVMQEAVVQEMEIRHEAERDLLMELMQDHNNSSLRTNARQMTEDNRQKRLMELKGARQEWRDSGPSKGNQEEQMDVFNKATALTLESRLKDMTQTGGESITEDDVQVVLLATLQQRQEQEASHLMEDLGSKTLTTLKQLKQVQYIARANGWNDNVAGTVLVTKSDSAAVTEEQLIKALEVKYDTLRDKLFTQALMSQIGECEWARLSERERQGKLMKLKLQERKLRQDGKYDEAAALLGQGIKDQQELAKLLGVTKSDQEQRVKHRLERRRQLVEQRKKEGLAVDNETLDRIIEKEEKKLEFEEQKKRRNILEDLNSHFESERDQLLATLRGRDASLKSERERQLALAKLRRDQRRLQVEERFDTAALIFSMAQQQEMSFLTDKERQKQLARERIADLKRKHAALAAQPAMDMTTEMDLVTRLRLEEEDNAKMDAVLATQKDVGVTLHTTILDEFEKKHDLERNVLLGLSEEIGNNGLEMYRVQQLTDEEFLQELTNVMQRWEDQQKVLTSEEISGKSEIENLDAVVELQHQKREVLKAALLLRMQDHRRTLRPNSKMTAGQLGEEVLVSLLADLQVKQMKESNALNKILSSNQDPEMPEADDSFLTQLIHSQRSARRELQLINLETTIFADILAAIQEEELDTENKQEEMMMRQELQQKMERGQRELEEKVRAMRAAGQDVDADALLAMLTAQHQAEEMALQEQFQEQRLLMRRRLAARKRKQEDKEYEEVAAMTLMQNAEETRSMMQGEAHRMRERQSSQMKDRLAQRREKRRQAEMAKEEEERKKQDAEEQASKKAKSASANRERLPSDLRMQREKTVIDVAVSEEKNRAIFDSLVREHTKAEIKRESEKQEQARMIKERIQERKNRYQNAADMLIHMEERQKTMVAKSQQEERERHRTKVHERIQKVRYERTQTMLLKKDPDAKPFKDLVGAGAREEGASSMSRNEKMANMAANMQKEFMEVIRKRKEGTLAPDDDDDDYPTEGASAASEQPPVAMDAQLLHSQSMKKLGDKERQMIMKEKITRKRKSRARMPSSQTTDPDTDSS